MILYILVFWSYFQAESYTVDIQVNNFKSDAGKAYLMILDEREKEQGTAIVSIKNNVAKHQFVVPKKGRYAIKVFHDANNNKKLDTNMLGIPKEQWGTSNNVKASLAPPDFGKMLFLVDKNTQIQIRLH